MPNPVTHFEVIGKNGKALQEFYKTVFDWHVDADNPMNYGLIDTHSDGKGIGGGIGEAGQEMPGASYVTVFAEVDDTDAYLKKAESLGGRRWCLPPSFRTW